MYVGIDIGGTNIKLALVSASGAVSRRGILETQPEQGPAMAFQRIHTALASLVGTRRVHGAGVGCAGLIDVERGVLRSSPNLVEWENKPLQRIAGRALGVYTIVDNDATCAAWGEYRCGGLRGVDDMVFITLGTGVGGGVISGGRLIRGAENYGGEIGHITVDPRGPKCRCGNRGCVEAVAGTYGMLRRARALMREGNSRYLSRWVSQERRRLTPMLLSEAARSGDRIARLVLNEAAEALGIAVASLVNVFNPAAVVVGGGVGASFDLLKPQVERTVRRRAFEAPAKLVRYEVSRLGNDATAVGAAMFARDRVKSRP